MLGKQLCRSEKSARRAPAPGARRLIVLICAALGFAVPTQAALAQPASLPAPDGQVLLTVTGNIARTNEGTVAKFDRTMLQDLPQATLETSTVVTDGISTFEGFYMADLLDLVGADGTVVTARALNDYIIDIPMEDFGRFDVVVATRMDGKQLLRRDKGPLWIVYPRDDYGELQDIRYDYRWVWQLIRLDIK